MKPLVIPVMFKLLPNVVNSFSNQSTMTCTVLQRSMLDFFTKYQQIPNPSALISSWILFLIFPNQRQYPRHWERL